MRHQPPRRRRHDAPPAETQKDDEQRWADLADLALTISRKIQHHGQSDPRAALLTQPEDVVMRHLLRGDPAAPNQITAATGLRRPNASAALRTLQNKGLIEKQTNPTDDRSRSRPR